MQVIIGWNITRIPDLSPLLAVNRQLLEQVVAVGSSASEAVLALYTAGSRQSHQEKADSTPVSEADIVANRIIQEGLSVLSVDIPIVSEESPIPSWEDRRRWAQYWLIDPLDGTSSFVRGKSQFTVNIALIQAGRPVLGVVCIPVEQSCYAAFSGGQAFKYTEKGDVSRIRTRRLRGVVGESVVMARSAYRGLEYAEELSSRLSASGMVVEQLPLGSSVKLCRVAEGVADIYPCFCDTCEWDTAAGQVILEEAGGVLFGIRSRKSLGYNQKKSLNNPWFCAVGDSSLDWMRWLPKE
ncbi:MAG: 3'(2'),5'-bisphosphate nucleotidase CysQ [bacterium]